MNYHNGTLIFSPSDLTLYMDSPFASWMEHYAILYPETTPEPDQPDLMMGLLQAKGNAHEQATLAELTTKGLSIENLSKSDNTIEGTINAMRTGVDIIYQASLAKLPFHGRADFLVKVAGASILGDYHYEIWDTKLSKTIKPNFIMQLCCYVDMLEDLQGCRPNNIGIILGNNEKVSLRTDNYFYYYQQLKNSFLSAHNNFNPKDRPDPADSKSWGRWTKYVETFLLEADHLSQIANITRSQIKKLNKSGIKTTQELINSENIRIPSINLNVLTKLKAQAKIQKESIDKGQPLFRIYVPEANQKQGLALLPPHSSLDIFFDIEGFPLEEDGLEYLWGSVFFDEHGNRQFKDFWAHNKTEERQAFKNFIEWAYLRWEQDPTMHIYHYANYEIAACRKLMGRYGICEYEVDQLLRNEVFVDLYKIVKGGLLLGEPRYSIKNVEHLYRDKRTTAIGTGDESIIFYDHWREIPDGDSWQTSKILNSIREYNIDDCNSTQELVVWLRQRQSENNIKYIGKTAVIEPEIKEDIAERIRLLDALLERSTQLAFNNNPDANIAEIFAWSLEFHRRENKPMFWRLFDRLGMEDHELLDDFNCLANCTRTNKAPFKPTPRARNLAYEYKFDPAQEFKGITKDYYILGEKTEDGKDCKVALVKEQSNFEEGIIVLQANNEPPSVINLVPDEHINPKPIPESIQTQAKAFYDNQLGSGAILNFLRRSIPNIRGHKPGKSIAPSNDVKEKLEQIIKAVINLNNSYLVIQGPPGTGKTYTAMHVIAELLKLGKRIGICSNSHKAINNLLINTAQYCKESKINASFICTNNTDPMLDQLKIKVLENAKLSLEIDQECVVGTTAWGFSRDDLANTFDYLFIDEAGQVSLANLIAISRSTKNIVLMGDQMQLAQPSQGTHPAESGSSILDYLLHDTPTIPEELGVFLGTTYRMHSAVNHFISSAIYDGKLKTDLNNDKQSIKIPYGYNGMLNKDAGIIFVPVEHEGNTQASDEEVDEIKKLVNELLGRIFTNKKGEQKSIGWEDMLFLAPYNHQVNKLQKSLGENAKVGSVDKFQGQEAPIVFLSMCASDASESPRGINFLFDKHRLNVAISRAQCLAIVVANPNLSQITASSVEQLSLVNIFCHLLVEYSYKKVIYG
jgi:uncharacterized protein